MIKKALITIKDFYIFTTLSWGYMKGLRYEFFTGFWPSWKRFNSYCKEDEV